MKPKIIVTFALVSAALSGCSTMVMKNPENAANISKDSLQTTAAAPMSGQEKARMLVQNLSQDLRFETGKADLKPKMVSALRDLAEIVASDPSTNITINGHADSTGTDRVNRPLSLERARAVSSILVRGGVSTERISVHGFSSERPLAENSSREGRAINRRAEIDLN